MFEYGNAYAFNIMNLFGNRIIQEKMMASKKFRI